MSNESRAVTLEINGKQREFDIDNPELPNWLDEDAFSSGDYPYEKKLKWKQYEETIEALQVELVKVQAWLKESDNRVISVFEGRDAAGKGGSINAVKQYMNHRTVRSVALPKPTERERGEWYYQRYVSHFPTSGEMVLYDRSWYNRAGVEPVMGFCTPEQHANFLQDTPLFEKMISDEGIYFFKFWLNIGREMQLKRFHDRRHNPLKIWKLSPMDIASFDKWDDYTKKRDLMLSTTHSELAPWTVVKANDKRRARINIIRTILTALPYTGKDGDVIGEIDNKIAGHGLGFVED
ncbi:polyphosphate kinase 2 [Lentilitoribacter sp. Alg239-R112]|jgi:polyphosphate kinase 2|uniref:polyphosphate kinase 2 n=1 Tax=Lentilitoribacter sp. Alg239-R112 TaxID=2305987 RepID=UPI0013A6E05A|nr:polyphosphate kinase 2 [Lentilitoribacter sp. Alg239-R112]